MIFLRVEPPGQEQVFYNNGRTLTMVLPHTPARVLLQASVTAASGTPSPLIAIALAGVGSPVSSTVGQFLWAGQPIIKHALPLNLFKCTLASGLFAIVLGVQLCAGRALATISPAVLGWLVLSAFFGIVIGDVMWLRAIELLGPVNCIMLGSFQPLISACFGWLFLGQTLPSGALIGVLFISVGLALPWLKSWLPRASLASLDAGAAASRDVEVAGAKAVTSKAQPSARRWVLGAMLQLFNVLADSVGSVITRRHGVGLSTWQINLVRFGSSGVLLTLFFLLTRLVARVRTRTPPAFARFPEQSRHAWTLTSAGVLLVTFAAPAMGNVALFGLPLGAWQALTATSPLWTLPVMIWLEKRRPEAHEVARALIVAAGAVLVSWAVHH